MTLDRRAHSVRRSIEIAREQGISRLELMIVAVLLVVDFYLILSILRML